MAFENVHNYYERLVFDEIRRLLKERSLGYEEDFIEDVACVALNQLPVRYVRHNVDFIFYLPTDERLSMTQDVSDAVASAFSFVESHRRGGE